MADRTTKMLLTIIALGLWWNVLASAFHIEPASAQISNLEFKALLSGVGDLQRSVSAISEGYCKNRHICP
jgi:hypothetical protein